MLRSKGTVLLIIAGMLACHFFYYPKWEKQGTEATLSWDVSGYYMYLPALFIYGDLKACGFQDDILARYGPTPDFQQAFVHPRSGNYVMKYSMGQALQFAPFFFIAHAWASSSDSYPPDGFSLPYQFMISMGSLLVAILGLLFLRKALLTYFRDGIVSLTLLGIFLGSNYLNYSAIDGAMTHNHLFTIYSLLILLTIRYYRNPSLVKSMGIGLLCGLATITRPTEILSLLIPFLWGVNLAKRASRQERLDFLKAHLPHLALASLLFLAVGSLQLVYWKYVSGSWLVYSYGDQGFSWLSPHIWKGLFSYRSGWLMYSPFMVFSLLGFYYLFRRNASLAWLPFCFSLLFIYVTFSWDIWWYGGSLGQRAMVQAYPILAFPLAAFFENFRASDKRLKMALAAIMGVFVYLNLWFTHQAHLGSMLYAGQMTGAYYWKTIGRLQSHPEDVKLLDNKEIFTSTPGNRRTLYVHDTTFLLDAERQFSPEIEVPVAGNPDFDWIRVSAVASIGTKEWNNWSMTQFIVELKNGGEVVKSSMIRIQRLLHDHQTREIHLDVSVPQVAFDTISVYFWNANGTRAIELRDISVEVFDE